MDMSRFSLMTQKHGIVHYLSMIGRMRLVTRPVIEHHGGEVVKFEADNCFAAFATVDDAIHAAIAVNSAFEEANKFEEDERNIRVSVGIDYGRFLYVENDYYGDPVNLACKLGEDVAGPGEILVTAQAMGQLSTDSNVQGTATQYSISGIRITAHHIVY